MSLTVKIGDCDQYSQKHCVVMNSDPEEHSFTVYLTKDEIRDLGYFFSNTKLHKTPVTYSYKEDTVSVIKVSYTF